MADPALPSFVLGYHGCDHDVAEQVLSGVTSFKQSANDYDWLGQGIYFWEHNAQRAFEFAREMASRPHPSGQNIIKPAVVGAIVDLGFCLNLLDRRYINMVRKAYDALVRFSDDSRLELPDNSGGADLVNRKLDCAVIRMLHRIRENQGDEPFDTLRAAFFEGEPLYENAGFAARTHIQLCVRNVRCILGYFRPLDDKGRPIRFD